MWLRTNKALTEANARAEAVTLKARLMYSFFLVWKVSVNSLVRRFFDVYDVVKGICGFELGRGAQFAAYLRIRYGCDERGVIAVKVAVLTLHVGKLGLCQVKGIFDCGYFYLGLGAGKRCHKLRHRSIGRPFFGGLGYDTGKRIVVGASIYAADTYM